MGDEDGRHRSLCTTSATADVTSSANVFETSQDLSVKAVSTRTSEENQCVTFAIYELRDGATEPTDGTLLYHTSRNFEYAGFHRLDLDWALKVKAGKKDRRRLDRVHLGRRRHAPL